MFLEEAATTAKGGDMAAKKEQEEKDNDFTALQGEEVEVEVAVTGVKAVGEVFLRIFRFRMSTVERSTKG